MKRSWKLFFGALGAFFALETQSFAVTNFDPNLTPGVLCTAQDPNFEGYYYNEHVARCKRNVNTNEKLAIAKEYGNIPQSNWPQYEFDHLLPLCAGGSDDIKNLWPQPRTNVDSLAKDKIEDEVCRGMQAGTVTQAEAVAKIYAFFGMNTPAASVAPPNMEQPFAVDEALSPEETNSF